MIKHTEHPDSEKQYNAIGTPFLYLDKQKFLKNLTRMRSHMSKLGTPLRPHFKTVKSLDALPYLINSLEDSITVSTLEEAEQLANYGCKNILYAVGISQEKLLRVEQLLKRGISIVVLLDSMEQVDFVNTYCQEHECVISCLIEIDCDGHRGGVSADSEALIAMAKSLDKGFADFKGVMLHAGESYHCSSQEALNQSASNEVTTAQLAAKRLELVGIHCEIVSIGSTPTACSYTNTNGITEVRAGVYSLFDLVMHQLGVCTLNDIAISVVSSVIGHNKSRGQIFVDAGWMALSLDKGHDEQCYGVVLQPNGQESQILKVVQVNQEHGILEAASGSEIDFECFPIGSRVHIVPNHACSTSAMHSQYHVFDLVEGQIEQWQRISGW
ncbi:alanine racemase [Shewanella algae]|uniref:alanine racemase n=1 Tax=Shewanella TaxID=22 RepID=UPI0021BEF23B|nr:MULTISPECIES: alanine racemase [Shewanella]MCT8979637.1 alanine racemase [Shewanella algae]MDE0566341.1 alanine racemase [Shewanella sp. K8]